MNITCVQNWYPNFADRSTFTQTHEVWNYEDLECDNIIREKENMPKFDEAEQWVDIW